MAPSHDAATCTCTQNEEMTAITSLEVADVPLVGEEGESAVVISSSSDDDPNLSQDQLSQMMREQDADLLESMHYAASQVSQYSRGGTPLLRPLDRALPLEDLPLMLNALSSTSQLLMTKEEASRNARFGSSVDDRSTPLNDSTGAHSVHPSLASFSSEMKCVLQFESCDLDNIKDAQLQPSDQRFRRLLSGEVRTIDLGGLEQTGRGDEEEGTTASPVSVAQEAASSIQQSNDTESGLAEERRVREAIQFAEAVGEKIGINRDELCIIEDHTDDGESCDTDDDKSCEPTEILVNPPSIHKNSTSDNKKEVIHLTVKKEPALSLPSHVDVRPNHELVRRKSKRPVWPFGPAGSEYRFLDNLSDGMDQSNFVYKGICANPPEITKRGIQRGNYALLHRKAWLEVSDKYHRYGKNLRLYYRYWEKLGFPTNQFFDWLDSKGEAAGQPLPNLEECPRSVLDSDTVLYITNPDVTEGYALEVVPNEDGRGRVIDVDGEPVITGSDGWIFVLRDNAMYGAQKVTSISGHSKQRFHHSSFFGGKAVAAAGIIITDDEGFLTRLYPHSGHYRPGEAHMQRMLFFLHRAGVDLRTFEMDTQQFRHVSREKLDGKQGNSGKNKDKDGEKKMKKVDSLHMEKAVNVACFLAHKAGFIGNGIFDKIHKIRKADVASVTEALDLVDHGGFWPKQPDPAEEQEDDSVR